MYPEDLKVEFRKTYGRVRLSDTWDSEGLLPISRRRYHRSIGGEPTLILESPGSAPRSESSQNQIDASQDGFVSPNWKTISKQYRISTSKLRRYLVWKILFDSNTIVPTPIMIGTIESLIPETMELKIIPPWARKVVEIESNPKNEKLQRKKPFDLQDYHFSKLLYFFLPLLQDQMGENFTLLRTERHIIFQYLEELGYNIHSLQRAFSQYKFPRKKVPGKYEKLLPILFKEKKPSRRRYKERRRRRSSEDRSGKAARSRLGNKGYFTYPGNLSSTPFYNMEGDLLGTQITKRPGPHKEYERSTKVSPRDLSDLLQFFLQYPENLLRGGLFSTANDGLRLPTKGILSCQESNGRQTEKMLIKEGLEALSLVNKVWPNSTNHIKDILREIRKSIQ